MRRLSLPLLLIVVLSGAPLSAQSFDAGDPIDRYKEDVMRSKLGPALGVDQSVVERLIQIDRKYNPMKESKKKEAIEAYRQLQQMMNAPDSSEKELRLVVDKVLRLPHETQKLQLRQLEEQMALLTPAQQARYLMFFQAMKKQMAQEARSLKDSPRGSRPLAPPRELPVVRPGP